MTMSFYRTSPASLDVFSTTTTHPRPPPLSREDSRILPSLDPERRSSSGSCKIPSISSINVHKSGTGHSPVQLPGLAALASIAVEQIIDSSTHLTENMSFATVAPGGATSANGMAASPPICDNCGTSTTPLWRRSENNTILCNACGLFLKLHNRARPISLKTDVIKSRNRIRTSGQGQQPKKKSSLDTVQSGLAAAHPELSYSSQLPQHNLGSYRRASQHFPGSDGIISRSSTPSTYPPHPSHTSNIAPQHLFDGVSIEGSPHHPYSSTHSPSFTHGSLHPSNLSAPPRNNSPSSSSLLNGATSHHVSETYDSLAHQNDKLKTRVSELEVINDLFRGRVAELERNEAEATRNLDDALRRLHQASSRLEEIERREKELGCNGDHQDSERSTKRLRMSMSDLIEDEGREDVETEAVVRANGTSGE